MLNTVMDTLHKALHPGIAHIVDLQVELRSLCRGEPAMGAVARFLDGLDHPARLAAVRGLCRGCQRRLFDAAQGFRQLTLDDLVPPSVGIDVAVHHHGKNSLPLFTMFQKRFLRPGDAEDQLWGYNFQALAPITGPGYYIARNAPERGEVDIDYTTVPRAAPAGWPAVQPNERGLATLVYGHMIDRLRGVTDHVTIGRAWRKGEVQPAWFVLCRE